MNSELSFDTDIREDWKSVEMSLLRVVEVELCEFGILAVVDVEDVEVDGELPAGEVEVLSSPFVSVCVEVGVIESLYI